MLSETLWKRVEAVSSRYDISLTRHGGEWTVRFICWGSKPFIHAVGVGPTMAVAVRASLRQVPARDKRKEVPGANIRGAGRRY